MKVCATCGREYLDMYESCPFCEQRADARPLSAPGAFTQSGALSPRHRPRRLLWFGAGTAVAGVALYLIIIMVNLFVVAPKAVDAGERVRCFAVQVQVERAVMMYRTENEADPASLDEIPAEYLPPERACPEGGAYSLDFLAGLPKVSCSIHGWHAGPE